jgi:ATP-dependent DNA ligase
VLVELLAEARAPLALVPMTPDRETARAWLTEHSAEGIEGVVAKHADHTYTARRAWQKIRTQLSGEAVVGGVLGPVDAPRALVLGRPDGRGHLRVVGQTLPLPRAASDELGAVLHPADAAHPWPATLRPRFGDATPLRYTRVRPDVVVELDVDTAQDDGRWRHPTRYRRQRVDLRTPDLEPRPSRDR